MSRVVFNWICRGAGTDEPRKGTIARWQCRRVAGQLWRERMKLKSIGLGLLASTMIAGAGYAQTINVAIDSSPAGLDPHLITAFNSVVIVQENIYESLTSIAQDLSVQPGLAESWEVSEDGLTYTFHLRQGVT